MKKSLAAICLLTFVPGFAAAADLAAQPVEPVAPVATIFNWTGFYAGLNAGGAFSSYKTQTTVPANSNINGTARAVAVGIGNQTIRPDAFIGGAQVGYNYQMGVWVLGVEADIDWMPAHKRHDTGPVPIAGQVGENIDRISSNYLSTIRGRVGYAWDRLLVYGTAGLAISDTKFERTQLWSFPDGCPVSANGLSACHVGSTSTDGVGYAVGAGIEYAFSDHWTVKGEYIFAGFNNSEKVTTQNPALSGQPIIFKQKSSDISVVRLGVNYKF